MPCFPVLSTPCFPKEILCGRVLPIGLSHRPPSSLALVIQIKYGEQSSSRSNLMWNSCNAIISPHFILGILFSDHLKLCFLVSLKTAFTPVFIVAKNYNTASSKFRSLVSVCVQQHNLTYVHISLKYRISVAVITNVK